MPKPDEERQLGPLLLAKHEVTRRQPSKVELAERIHLPGESPEAVARIVMQGGAPRREPEKTDS